MFVTLTENPKYEISRKGIVRHKTSKRGLKHRDQGRVHLGKKKYYIYRLLATTFIPNPKRKKIVIHKDGDSSNNSLKNLKWGDMQAMQLNLYKKGKHTKGGKALYQMTVKGKILKRFESCTLAAEAVGVSLKVIRAGCNQGKVKAGFKWKYVKSQFNMADPSHVWKPIIIGGKTTLYSASHLGEIKNKTTGRLIKQSTSSYATVTLRITGKPITKPVHQLVANCFHGIRNNDDEVDHIDRNKRNNRAENLRWATALVNTTAALGKKVCKIDLKTKQIVQTFDSVTQARENANIPQRSFHRYLHGYSMFIHNGFGWQFQKEN